MPKCPKCGEEIDYLKIYEPGEMRSDLCLAGEKEVYVEEKEFISDVEFLGKDEDVECPVCNEVLFHNREKAKAFLKGEEYKEEE